MPESRAAVSPVLIAVSLKMYFGHRQALSWCAQVARLAREHPAIQSRTVSLVVLPAFTAIAGAVELLSATGVQVGAQDVFWADHGPFTGEVSGQDLAEAGCRFAEVGHAERRRMFGETDAVVAQKLAAARRHELIPLLCVGETEPMAAGAAADFAIAQGESAFQHWAADPAAAGPAGLSGLSLVVAYEPVWAIGAPHPADISHIVAVCGALRQWLNNRRPGIGESRVLYGGSAGPGLLSRLGSSTDGLFLGRSAHDPAALAAVLDEIQAGRHGPPPM